jgi:AbrB family looped-hinge helix DNA binding protein
MSEATLTRKGQITIPADIRRAMGVSAQDRVVFTRLDDGTVVMRAKIRSVLELRGLLRRDGDTPPVPVENMRIGRS